MSDRVLLTAGLAVSVEGLTVESTEVSKSQSALHIHFLRASRHDHSHSAPRRLWFLLANMLFYKLKRALLSQRHTLPTAWFLHMGTCYDSVCLSLSLPPSLSPSPHHIRRKCFSLEATVACRVPPLTAVAGAARGPLLYPYDHSAVLSCAALSWRAR